MTGITSARAEFISQTMFIVYKLRSSVARLQIALDEFFRGKHSASDDETVLKTLNALSHHGRIAILRIVADQAGLSFPNLKKRMICFAGIVRNWRNTSPTWMPLKTFGKRISESRCVETGFR